LLLGESGTGKDVFAQAIHNFSTRKNGPFISLNCGTIPKELVSSELFGYEEGAFTGTKKQGSKGKFELANSGTIFLDEIGEMPIEIQASLLRVIEQRIIYRLGGQEAIPVNIRIIAATNKDILAAAKAGRFRLDLYYRLNVLPIKLIPLREHKSDIPLLVDSFLAKLSREHNKPVKALSPDVMDILVNYDWPGNIRELKNAIERCIVLSSGENITTKFLQDEIVNFAQNKLAQAEPTHYEHKEKDQLVALLEKYRWNVSKVAAEFGVARSTAYKKLKFYNLLK
jgi:transcriptional regulator with PAS, ATPase and Fis domain